MRTKVSLCYDDVLLVPQFSDIRSRKEIDISTTLGIGARALELSLPIISSPMDTVTGPAMAEVMNIFGGVGIIHRYCTIAEQAEMIRAAKQNRYHSTKNDLHINVGGAVGATGDFEERATALHEAGVDFLCWSVCMCVSQCVSLSVCVSLFLCVSHTLRGRHRHTESDTLRQRKNTLR